VNLYAFVQMYGDKEASGEGPEAFLGAIKVWGDVGDVVSVPVPRNKRVRRVVVSFNQAANSPEGP
jgi:hypothetical protein